MTTKTCLRLILGDQLNHQHSWFTQTEEHVFYVLMEMRQETEYVRHHIQKVIAFFEAMKRFTNQLRDAGHHVIYLQVDDPENTGDLKKNLRSLIEKYKIERFEYQEPDEYRLDQQLKEITSNLNITTQVFSTEHFITSRTELGEIFKGKKQFLMESFYRVQRQKTGILMHQNLPVGGQWNFDHDNRKSYDKKISLPPTSEVINDVSETFRRIQDAGIETIGKVDPERFPWPLDRAQALIVLHEFIEHRLSLFGTFQDAMTDSDAYLFHSKLSFALNSKLLNPLEVIRAVEKAYHESEGQIELNQAEGFIRQILGWREYMRGIYWLKMPEFANMNFFEHHTKLPSWFWTGETKMHCLSHSIHGSLNTAYAHHIQRLMVTGNFALLAGIDPDELDAWYLGIYIDAIEWVEITNTRGMSQFADGGIVGTKPYVSSAAYIDKMGDYCKTCHYNKKEKTGDSACPFNSLYWHFYERNRTKMERNPRIGMMYKVWDRMDIDKKEAILIHAEHVLDRLDDL